MIWPTYYHSLGYMGGGGEVGQAGRQMTCVVLGDAGELLVQEALQVGGGGGGSQALHQLQIH